MSTKKTKMPSIDIGISEADRAKIVKGLSAFSPTATPFI